jgi:hypothetical protein
MIPDGDEPEVPPVPSEPEVEEPDREPPSAERRDAIEAIDAVHDHTAELYDTMATNPLHHLQPESEPEIPGTTVAGRGDAGLHDPPAEGGELSPETALCPICLVNPDIYETYKRPHSHCTQCGQPICGECTSGLVESEVRKSLLAGLDLRVCPMCRAPWHASPEKHVQRLRALLHSREPGSWTPLAQNTLATYYDDGEGVEKDSFAATKLFRASAESGYAIAQSNLGICYVSGDGV